MNLTNLDKYPKRLMYCSSCKLDRMAEGHNPICPKCHKTLLNILYIGETWLTGREYKFPEIDFKTKLSIEEK